MVNSSQSSVAAYKYDPFGNLISSSGTLAGANVYRFSSKEIHVNSGMYYYGFRFYDPNLQRWINRDPILENGGLNLFSFSGNRPVGEVDPYGLDCRRGADALQDYPRPKPQEAPLPPYPFATTPPPTKDAQWDPNKGRWYEPGVQTDDGPWALLLPFAAGPRAGLGGEAAAAEAAREAALQARHVAEEALRAAEEVLAEKLPAVQKAQSDMVEAALQHGNPSAQLGDAAKTLRNAEAEIRPYRDALREAQRNFQRANDAAKNCGGGG